MTRRGSRADRSERVAPVGTPAQEDEADILEEVGGERNESGDLIADEAAVRAVGAVDAESVLTNRRMKDVVDKKRGGMKGVTFNTDDLLASYEVLIKEWPPNTIDITVRRMTGTQVTRTITSRPRSGVELYEALKLIHGQYEEAEYEVKCLDTNQKQYRCTRRITMPDTRAAPPQGQPMQTFYPNGAPVPPGYSPQPAPGFYPPAPGYPPPPGYAAPPPPAQGHQPPPQQQQQPLPQPPAAPQQAPAVQMMPPSFDPSSMMTMMDQLFQLFVRLQATGQPPPQPTPQYLQYAPPPQAPMMPPPPSPQASPAEQFEWMQRAFGIFQQITQQQQQQQQPAQAPAHREPPQPQYVQAPPAAQAGPTTRPPPGFVWGWFPEFSSFALIPEPNNGAGAGSSPGPFRPRPAYLPQGDQARAAYTWPHQQQQHAQPPPRVKTPREQFQESIGFVREAASAVEEMQSLLPGFGGQHEAPEPQAVDDDDNPIKIIDTGKGRIAVNKSDGALRWAETGMMVLPDVLKWLGEQHQVIQKAHAERQQPQQQQPRQLPPGYVEVGPNYQPPPGYVAIPVDQQSPLPPPPTNVPPPIQTATEPRRAWGSPTIPDQGENG